MILFVSITVIVVLVIIVVLLGLAGTIFPFLPDFIYEILQRRKDRRRDRDLD
jgi:hypothetical protein